MRFLFDQSFDRRLVEPLRDAGHDIEIVAVDYPPSLADPEVLAIALREERILLTLDRDFGELAIRERLPHAGIIYMRVRPTSVAFKLARLMEALEVYSEHPQHYLAVTEDSVRIVES